MFCIEPLDAINLLYVTFTRAISRLYIISKNDLNSKGEPNNRTYSGLFIDFLQHKNMWNVASAQYEFGQKHVCSIQDKNPKVEKAKSLFISIPKESHDLKNLAQAEYLWDTDLGKARDRGNLLHLALSKIKTRDDVGIAFEELSNHGFINSKIIDELKIQVNSILTHPLLSEYYSNQYIIYNERDIISAEGQFLRPDRIVIKDNTAVIIDYKTGAEKPSHFVQISEYGELMENMGYRVLNKLLVYTDETLKIVNA